MLSEDQFKAWKELPESKALFSAVFARKERLKEQWASGQFTELFEHATAIKNAQAIGECKMLEWILELDFDAINQGVQDGEHDRLEAARQSGSGAAHRSST